MSKTYTLNQQKAVSETLEGETIAINLIVGSYFSFTPAASTLWELLLQGHSLEQAGNYMTARYGIEQSAVETFVDSLVAEDLLLVSNAAPIATPETWSGAQESGTLSFEKYDDMQEMLLADPIHDVEGAGWPFIKKD